jgi:hypothetical protein
VLVILKLPLGFVLNESDGISTGTWGGTAVISAILEVVTNNLEICDMRSNGLGSALLPKSHAKMCKVSYDHLAPLCDNPVLYINLARSNSRRSSLLK